MGLAKSVNAYHDVKVVLDAALKQGGATYELPNNGAATHWCHRAYYYRQLLHELKAEANLIPGVSTATPYDSLVLKRRGNVVHIGLREPEGKLRDADGNELPFDNTGEEDELEKQARELAQRLSSDDSD